MKLSSLVLPNNEFRSDDLLSAWRWLVGADASVSIVTKTGDAFLQKTDGVYFLNLGENRFEKICDSLPEFSKLLEGREFVARYFLPDVQREFLDSGRTLETSQVIGYKLPPTLGGSFEIGNLEATDASVHFSLIGQIALKIKDLPAGTPIGKVTLE